MHGKKKTYLKFLFQTLIVIVSYFHKGFSDLSLNHNTCQ